MTLFCKHSLVNTPKEHCRECKRYAEWLMLEILSMGISTCKEAALSDAWRERVKELGDLVASLKEV